MAQKHRKSNEKSNEILLFIKVYFLVLRKVLFFSVFYVLRREGF